MTAAPGCMHVVPGVVAVQTWSAPGVVPVPHAAELATTKPVGSMVAVAPRFTTHVLLSAPVPGLVPLPQVNDPESLHTPFKSC